LRIVEYNGYITFSIWEGQYNIFIAIKLSIFIVVKINLEIMRANIQFAIINEDLQCHIGFNLGVILRISYLDASMMGILIIFFRVRHFSNF
jgi:hypothetical protein